VVADGQHRPRAIRERRFERAQDLGSASARHGVSMS
jgi:hypothetical protein